MNNLPYDFISIPVDQNGDLRSISDKPVFHDGREADGLLSGELRCTLTALTPLLAANDQYPASEVRNAHVRQDEVVLPPSWGIDQPVAKDKTVLEPLRLKDGRVAIAGTALKGMLRQSLGALLAAPMERVAERSYSYRPNLEFPQDRKHEQRLREPRPAIVESCINDVLTLKVLPWKALTRVLFVHDRFFNKLPNPKAGERQGVDVAGLEIQGVRQRQRHRLVAGGGPAPVADYLYFHYAGGIDGCGGLAEAFNNGSVYRHLLVPQDLVASATLLTVPGDVLEMHRATVKHLADGCEGHLRAEHPLTGKAAFGRRRKEIASGIADSSRIVCTPGYVIFVEVAVDQKGAPTAITSLGQNYRYRWRYADTVRKRWTSNGPEPRKIVSPLTDEQVAEGDGKNDAPQRLSGARLLFGYVADEKNEGVARIGSGVFRQLAGRLAFNIAVEQVSDGIDPATDDRFLAADRECVVPLKILGTPRPSAVEHYIDQSRKSARRDRGIYVSYGDLPGEPGGELNGRKFYRHQPDAAVDPACYEERSNEAIKGNQAALARFLSIPRTHFRFTLRFRDLRQWELGAVLAGLDPGRLQDGSGNAQTHADSMKPEFALKLGHGRPLGLGSVRIDIDAVALFEPGEALRDDGSISARAVNAFRARGLDPSVTRQWLAMHRYRGLKRFDYPTDYQRDGRGEPRGEQKTIFDHHTNLRRRHSLERRWPKPE